MTEFQELLALTVGIVLLRVRRSLELATSRTLLDWPAA
jgi:hypothetical protein